VRALNILHRARLVVCSTHLLSCLLLLHSTHALPFCCRQVAAVCVNVHCIASVVCCRSFRLVLSFAVHVAAVWFVELCLRRAKSFCKILSLTTVCLWTGTLFITAWRHARVVYAVVVCLSLSVTSLILLKRLNVGSCKQCHIIAKGLQFSGANDLGKTQMGSPPTEARNADG